MCSLWWRSSTLVADGYGITSGRVFSAVLPSVVLAPSTGFYMKWVLFFTLVSTRTFTKLRAVSFSEKRSTSQGDGLLSRCVSRDSQHRIPSSGNSLSMSVPEYINAVMALARCSYEPSSLRDGV